MEKIGVVSASAYRSWERYGISPQIKYYPKIMQFLGYCPIQYCQSEAHRLKLMREHIGLPYRQVDKLLKLSKGCTYRAETVSHINPYVCVAITLWDFYRSETPNALPRGTASYAVSRGRSKSCSFHWSSSYALI